MAETKFGLNQFNNKTPKWAKSGFYIATAVIGVAMFVIQGDAEIASNTAKRLMLYLKGLDMLLLALSRMFGENTEQEETPANDN